MSKSSRTHLLILLSGIALALPSLGAGFFADDFWHLSVLSGKLPSGFAATPIDLFRFGAGNTGGVEEQIRNGFFPWWTDTQLRAAFFRPLTALTHIADYRLWGANPAGYHATNILLWAMVLLTGGVLIRRLAPTERAAALSFFVFAAADARALDIAWIANRNALAASALAFATLIEWDSFRRGRGGTFAVLAWCLCALSLLAGETALGVFALLFAYEAMNLPEGIRPGVRRIVPAIPFAVIAAVYALGYKLAGYGARGSGMYLDPATSPGEWLAAAVVRLPVLLAGLLWAWPIDFWLHGGIVRTVIAAGAMVLLPLTAMIFTGILRRHKPVAAAALGGVLALIPLTATFPSTRLLLLPGVPGALLIGTYLDGALPLKSSGGVRRIVAAMLGLRHVILAPLLLLGSLFLLSGAFRENRDGILNTKLPEDVSARNVALLNTPHWSSATYLIPCLGLEGRPYPRAAHLLNLSPFPASVTRTGPSTLELRLHCGELLTTEFERLERKGPIPVGAVVEAGALRATVLDTGVLGPKAVRFDFLENLDSGPILLRWDGSRYQTLRAPAVGAGIELAGVAQGIGRLRSPAPVCGTP